MENILIIPENKKQFAAIKKFLEVTKINFKTEKGDDTLMNEEEFYAKIDRSINHYGLEVHSFFYGLKVR